MIKHINFSTGDYHRKLQTSVLLLLLSCFAFVFVPYIVADANATTNEVYGNITWSLISLSLDTGGDVNFGTITPSVNNGTNLGTMVVAKKNVKISSNGKSARVYLSANSTTENWLSLDGSSTLTIPAVSGTWDSPAAFSGKGFGFAVPDKTVSGTTVYSTPFATDTAFDASFGLANNTISAQLQSGDEDNGYKAQTWAAVPLKGAEKKIYDVSLTGATTLDGDNNRNNFDVYYAVMADESLISGTYSNAIVYTALAANTSLTGVSNNMSVTNVSSNGINIATKRFANAGDTLSLKFDFAADAGLVTAANTKVYLVPHSTVASANYTLTTAIRNATSSYPTCLIASNSDISASTDGVSGTTIDCTISDGTSGTVAPTIADNTASDLNGFYDVWAEITVNGQKIDYLSKYEPTSGTYAPAVVFAGLQSKYNNDYLVKTMQDMTAQVCNLTNKWNRSVGTSARVYDYRGEDGNNPVAAAVSTPGQQSDALGVGTFALTDSRDNKDYLVRRLADGNCWMVQNLDLDLTVASNRILNPATTDVSSAKTLSNKNLSEEIGSNCSEQYQPYNVAGSNCLWGSTKGGISVTNNEDSAFARSYSNTVNSNPRYIPTNQITGATTSYTNSNNGTNVNSGDEVPTTTSYIPSTTLNSGNAVGYAGNMYIGTYYNWYAAVAETGEFEMVDQTMSDSICPRSWQLPAGSNIGGNSSEAINLDKSWTKLLKNTANGYGSALSLTTDGGPDQTGTSDGNTTAVTNMHKLPLSIPFAGTYGWNEGTVHGRGVYGLFLSDTIHPSSGVVLYLYLNSVSVWTQGTNTRNIGFSVRCVAR